MARQLPAVISGQRSLSHIEGSPSTVSRALASIAPDIIRAAGRIANQRLQSRGHAHSRPDMSDHTKAVHLSEIEIDVAMPFVRRITMRNLTAWQNAPMHQIENPKPEKSGIGLGRKVGLLGASSVLALCLGVLARRIGPFSNPRESIIDVVGKPKS
ncbi:hypothetical protein BH23CHL2_BH23CHL2_05070 [soil metagenome]